MSLINKKTNFKTSLGWLKPKPGRRSTYDWMFFVAITFLLIIVSLVYHLSLFINADSDSSIGTFVITASRVDTLDRDSLKKTVDYLSLKKGIPVESLPLEEEATSSDITLPSTRQ